MFLDMARQAIVARFSLFVAPHAPAHRHLAKRFGRRLFPLSDIPMTGLALDLSKNNMGLVRIKDMIGLSIDALPGDLFSLFGILPDLFFFGTLGDGFLMALQTDRVIRHSGECLGLIVFVTVVTCEALVDMFFVVKSDRLSSFKSYTKADKEEHQEETDHQAEEEESHLLGTLHSRLTKPVCRFRGPSNIPALLQKLGEINTFNTLFWVESYCIF